MMSSSSVFLRTYPQSYAFAAAGFGAALVGLPPWLRDERADFFVPFAAAPPLAAGLVPLAAAPAAPFFFFFFFLGAAPPPGDGPSAVSASTSPSSSSSSSVPRPELRSLNASRAWQ